MNPHSSMEPMFWVHSLSPFLWRFSESFGIRYYGIAYLAGFLTAALMLRLYRRTGRSDLAGDAQSSLLLALVVGVLVGGRLGYFLLYAPGALLQKPLTIFRLWDGGMSSHGGFAGVCLALFWTVRKYHLPWRTTADVLATLAPPGLFFGRVANFINGELWGKVSHVPWAIIFPASAPEGTPLSQVLPRHPSQLYEALLEGAFLCAYTQLRFWRGRAVRERPGHLAGEFLILYGVVRAVGEVFREPDASLLLGLSRGTFYSLFLVIGGLLLLATSRTSVEGGKQRQHHPFCGRAELLGEPRDCSLDTSDRAPLKAQSSEYNRWGGAELHSLR